MALRKGTTDIRSLEQWLELAGPKGGEKQWVDGRSAKECARAWLGSPDGMPPEIAGLLQQLAGGPLRIERIEPEALLAFDRHSGPRNADMAMWAHDEKGPLAVTIEAKADESFDELMPDVLAATLDARITTPASGALSRATDLAASLFWPRQPGEPALAQMRYQLLTATAGTLAMAHGCGATRAVMIVHEFRSAQTSGRKLLANADDLDAFVCRLSRGVVGQVVPGLLYGPLAVPGKPLFVNPAALFIGKVVRELGEPAP